MSRREGELAYRRMRAPTTDRAAFVDFDWDSITAPMLSAAMPEADFVVLDSTRRALSESARRQLIQSAQDNCRVSQRAYDGSQPLILSGHQPELFHAGVWFKNFALARLAKRFNALPVNLEIDNDLCRTTAIRCPRSDARGLNANQFSVDPIAYDEMGDLLPYEERGVVDLDCFRTFGARAVARMRGVVDDPIVESLWPEVVREYERRGKLGAALAAGRRTIERRAGVENLEAPLHRVCETDEFRRFCLHMLVRASEFANLHNASLQSYRRVNRIRSLAHPAPQLISREGWIESPFWIWRSDSPNRRRAFVARDPATGGLRFGAPNDIVIQLPDPQQDPLSAVAALRQASESGVRVRSRALVTTMYSRLFLADLFLHGIGGAKYDQLTDELIRRFWQVTPPHFVTVTATVRLPLPLHGVESSDIREIDDKIRSLRFHPERHLKNRDETARALVEEKQHLIAQHSPLGAGKPRQQRLDAINRELQTWLVEEHESERQRRSENALRYRSDRRLGSREFSYCLHSLATLPRLLLDLCAKPS